MTTAITIISANAYDADQAGGTGAFTEDFSEPDTTVKADIVRQFGAIWEVQASWRVHGWTLSGKRRKANADDVSPSVITIKKSFP